MEAEMAENPVVALDGLGELQGDFCPSSSDVLRFLDVRAHLQPGVPRLAHPHIVVTDAHRA